jgi:hypothetical protein
MKNLTATAEGGRYFRYHFLGFPCAYIAENGKKCIWNVCDENVLCCKHHKDHEDGLQQERRNEEEHKQPCQAILKSGQVCGVSFCKRHRYEYCKEWRNFIKEHSHEVKNRSHGAMMKNLGKMYREQKES